MTIVVHVAPVSDVSTLNGSVNNLFPLSHFAWRRHSPSIGGLEIWSHMVKIVLSGLLLYFDEPIVVLNVLVTRILFIEWVVLLRRVDCPYLLAVVHGRVIRQFTSLLASWLLVSSFIHLNNLVLISCRIHIFFLGCNLNFENLVNSTILFV